MHQKQKNFVENFQRLFKENIEMAKEDAPKGETEMERLVNKLESIFKITSDLALNFSSTRTRLKGPMIRETTIGNSEKDERETAHIPRMNQLFNDIDVNLKDMEQSATELDTIV